MAGTGTTGWKAGAFGPKSDGLEKLDANGEPEYVAPGTSGYQAAPKAEDFSQHVRLIDPRRVWMIEGRGGKSAEIEIEFLNGTKVLPKYFLVEDLRAEARTKPR